MSENRLVAFERKTFVYKNRFYIAAGSANRGGGPDQSSIEMLLQK